MKILITCLALIVLILGCAATKSILFTAVDFTEDGEFTSGIEGPATDHDGNIYAVNFGENGTIGKISPDGKTALFVNLPTGSIGNGIRINQHGDLLVADYTGHNILLINSKTKAVSKYVHNPTMNQPNDLAIKSNGILFLSDPNWKESSGNIWRVNTNRSIDLLESNMGTTNGIEISPDEKTLYVNESVSRIIWAYDLSMDGATSNKRKFHQFEDFGLDGMRCDDQGNLYVTRHGKGTVAIIDKEGKLIEEIKLKGKKPSNLTFGGQDGKTCYVTLQDRGSVESFKTRHAGRSWSFSH